MSSLQRREYLASLGLALPALAVLAVFWFWPVIQSVYYSFHDYNLLAGTLKYTGTANYARALVDPNLIRSVKVTLLFFLYRVPLQAALGLGLALFVRGIAKGMGPLRTLILLPTVTPMIVVATVWGIMYHPTDGLFNSILALFNLPPQRFLISATQALPSIVVLTIWKNVGLTMIYYLAGLNAIPAVYYEAAMIDGANGWQRLWHITLPLLKRTTLFVVVTTTVFAFQVFTPIFVTTQGGPAGATRVIVLYIYDLAFRFNRMGYASTVSVILAVLLIAVSIMQFAFARDRAAR